MGYFTSNHFGSAHFNSNYFGGQNSATDQGGGGIAPWWGRGKRPRSPRLLQVLSAGDDDDKPIKIERLAVTARHRVADAQKLDQQTDRYDVALDWLLSPDTVVLPTADQSAAVEISKELISPSHIDENNQAKRDRERDEGSRKAAVLERDKRAQQRHAEQMRRRDGLRDSRRMGRDARLRERQRAAAEADDEEAIAALMMTIAASY